jgi:hypothetical protein
MTEAVQFELGPEEAERLRQLRASLSDFRAMLASLPDEKRSVEHNQQFNQMRLEARTLLGGVFAEEVPKAITGDVTTDRSISLIVILGVILALGGLGLNSVILDDVTINSLGCCISSGGMLLVIGAFAVLARKNIQERVNDIYELRERCDLLMLEIDHRLKMAGTGVPHYYPE